MHWQLKIKKSQGRGCVTFFVSSDNEIHACGTQFKNRTLDLVMFLGLSVCLCCLGVYCEEMATLSNVFFFVLFLPLSSDYCLYSITVASPPTTSPLTYYIFGFILFFSYFATFPVRWEAKILYVRIDGWGLWVVKAAI